MRVSVCKLVTASSLLLALSGLSHQAVAAPFFTDNFEDRVNDQALIGNDWTW